MSFRSLLGRDTGFGRALRRVCWPHLMGAGAAAHGVLDGVPRGVLELAALRLKCLILLLFS